MRHESSESWKIKFAWLQLEASGWIHYCFFVAIGGPQANKLEASSTTGINSYTATVRRTESRRTVTVDLSRRFKYARSTAIERSTQLLSTLLLSNLLKSWSCIFFETLHILVSAVCRIQSSRLLSTIHSMSDVEQDMPPLTDQSYDFCSQQLHRDCPSFSLSCVSGEKFEISGDCKV